MIFKKFCLHKWLPCQTNILRCWTGYVQDLLELPFWCNQFILIIKFHYLCTYNLISQDLAFPLSHFTLQRYPDPPQIPSTNSMIVPTWSLNIFILLIHRIRPILPENNWNSWSQKKIATVFSLKHETSTERNDLFLKFDIDVRLDYYRNLSISVIKVSNPSKGLNKYSTILTNELSMFDLFVTISVQHFHIVTKII